MNLFQSFSVVAGVVLDVVDDIVVALDVDDVVAVVVVAVVVAVPAVVIVVVVSFPQRRQISTFGLTKENFVSERSSLENEKFCRLKQLSYCARLDSLEIFLIELEGQLRVIFQPK